MAYTPKINWVFLLILITFFVKGVFLVALSPLFEGQDESRHYNTIQYLNESEAKEWKVEENKNKEKQRKGDFSTYRFSEEIRETSRVTNNHLLRNEKFNTLTFSNSFEGINEEKINLKKWEARNKLYPPDITGLKNDNLYHKLGLAIEKSLENKNILIRFYSIKILSVFLATLTILFFYLTSLKIGFSEKISLLLTATISFHPNFSFYTTDINYAPLLFLSFSIFIYGGALYLKNGMNWTNISILIISTIIGLLTKGTAIVLIVILLLILIFEIYKKTKKYFKNSKYILALLISLALLAVLIFFNRYLPSFENRDIASIFSSLINYITETVNLKKFRQTSISYWGLMGSTDSIIIILSSYLIWLVELLAVAGLGLYFFSKRKVSKHLPKKKYSWFLVLMITTLQLGIRLADWKYFDKHGEIGLGAPGRYFLPTIMAHISLIYIGIGALLCYFKKDRYLQKFLVIGLVLMFSLFLYLTLNVMVYKYYLL